MKYRTVDLPGEFEEAFLTPLSDIHWGSPNFRFDKLQELLGRVQTQKNHYLAINGDLMDNATRSGIGDTFAAVVSPNEQRKAIVKTLDPHRDRILCMTDGNHEERTHKDSSIRPVELIAEKLGVPYDAEGVVLNIRVGQSHRHLKRRISYHVYVTHFYGGGKLPGGKMNNAQRVALTLPTMDVYVFGHVHDMMGRRDRYYDTDARNEAMVDRDRLYVIAGSFLDWGGYSERKGYIPGALGMPTIRLDGRTKRAEVVL